MKLEQYKVVVKMPWTNRDEGQIMEMRQFAGSSSSSSSSTAPAARMAEALGPLPSSPESGVLFRSEPMSRCQLILQSESAYNCISELGELGVVQFVDLNPDVSAFQRKFVGEVKRCEEMERKLRYIQREAIRDEIEVAEPDENPAAPAPREMSELETSLSNLERDLSDVNTNYVALKKNELELKELKHLLLKTEQFLSESSLQLADSAADEESRSKFASSFFTGGGLLFILFFFLFPCHLQIYWKVSQKTTIYA